MVHRVAVVALPGVVPSDLTVACDVFGRAVDRRGRALYRVCVCAEGRHASTGYFDVATRHGLGTLARADTVIVPGVDDPAFVASSAVVRAIRAAARRGARVASVCTGAFVLAQTGLLDGLRVTTHWLAAPLLVARFPALEVDAKVLYVDHGSIVTSAGAAAGIDMCLHLVRRDFGAEVAAATARAAVVPLEREGGQAQFIDRDAPAATSEVSLAPVQDWIVANLRRPLTLADIARRAAMSTRTLNRRFRDQTGTTPLQWLLRARVRRAQQLLERADRELEDIATQCGFSSATTLRARFRRVVGTSPTAYRRAFCARGT